MVARLKVGEIRFFLPLILPAVSVGLLPLSLHIPNYCVLLLENVCFISAIGDYTQMPLSVMQGHYVNVRNYYFSAYLEKIKVIINIFITRWGVILIFELHEKPEI